jgi:hypothetical protein
MFELNEILTFKKKHMCGSNDWKIIRTGADFKLECVGCKRVIMMSRVEIEKKIKKTN